MVAKKKKRKTKPAKVKVKKRFAWKTKQLDAFFYWINERHSIFLKRIEGVKKNRRNQGWPWTKDKILRRYKFTNPFRQNDAVTQQWIKRYLHLLTIQPRKPLSDADLLFHLCMFRLFNYPSTYDTLYYGLRNGWNRQKALKLLLEKRDGENSPDRQLFTGAYTVTPGPGAVGKGVKLETYIDVLEDLWDGRTKKQKERTRRKIKPRRIRWAAIIRRKQSMRKTVKLLTKLNCVGKFIAYEIACDLRHTQLLADAKDVMSWANAGPGAERGIHRILYGKKTKPSGAKIDYNKAMRDLLRIGIEEGKLSKDVMRAEYPFEMREIEHSLCEFDKWSRVKNGEGKPRSIFTPPHKRERLPWDD